MSRHRKGKGEKTACTIVKADNLHEKYPQTMKSLSVTAVEYGGIARGHLRALLFDLDQKKVGSEAACVTMIKEARSKKAPKTIEVFALENEDYYAGRRFPGDIYHAGDPDLPGRS